VLGILGAALLALGIGAVVKQSNYDGKDTYALPYFVGGFLVGILVRTFLDMFY
jgi:Na+/glutamate symporter